MYVCVCMLYLDVFSLHNHFKEGLQGMNYDVEFSELHCVVYGVHAQHFSCRGFKDHQFSLCHYKKGRVREVGSKKTFYIGIKPCESTSASTSESDTTSQSCANNSDISSELKRLHLEVGEVLSSDGLLIHGPDTIAIEVFSLNSLFSEFRQLAPGLVELCLSLGDTKRNSNDDYEDAQLGSNDIKVLVSMCTLLNARSRQVKGLQLLLSLMLVARAINKQVSYYHINNDNTVIIILLLL